MGFYLRLAMALSSPLSSAPHAGSALRSPPKCDVIHIDGDHSLAGARADFTNFRALAKIGTLFLFDDCGCPAEPAAEYCQGPTRVFNEALAAGLLKRVSFADLALSYPHSALGGKGTCAAYFVGGGG